MMTEMKKAKTWMKHISCDCKCIIISTTWNSTQKWNNDICWCEGRKYRHTKKGYSWNLRLCIYENGKYLKNIADSSVTVFDKIINSTDSVLANVTSTIPAIMTNTISVRVASTVSINSDDRKVRYKKNSYVFHTVLSVIIPHL